MLDALNVLINVLYIVFWAYILTYIMKLEAMGCQCAKDWRREFIKYYIGFIMILIVSRTVDAWTPETVPPVFMTIQFVLTIFFVFVVYNYISDLKRNKCACSADVARDVLEIFNMIQMFLLAFVLIVMIHIMFTIAQASMKMNKSLSEVLKTPKKKYPPK